MKTVPSTALAVVGCLSLLAGSTYKNKRGVSQLVVRARKWPLQLNTLYLQVLFSSYSGFHVHAHTSGSEDKAFIELQTVNNEPRGMGGVQFINFQGKQLTSLKTL